jgi:hypothetical protein
MGYSRASKYRLEIKENGKDQVEAFVWKGRASLQNLVTWITEYSKSLEAGGSNEHYSKSLCYIPYPVAAQIIHQKTGKVTVSWQASPIQLIEG